MPLLEMNAAAPIAFCGMTEEEKAISAKQFGIDSQSRCPVFELWRRALENLSAPDLPRGWRYTRSERSTRRRQSEVIPLTVIGPPSETVEAEKTVLYCSRTTAS